MMFWGKVKFSVDSAFLSHQHLQINLAALYIYLQLLLNKAVIPWDSLSFKKMDSDVGLPRPESASLVRTISEWNLSMKQILVIYLDQIITTTTDGALPRHPAGKRDWKNLSSGDLCSHPGTW